MKEVSNWATSDHPTKKFRLYLESKGFWSAEKETALLAEAKNEILTAFSLGEQKLKHKWTEMYEDVYKFVPPHIKYVFKHINK